MLSLCFQISVLPESAFPLFPLVEMLRGFAGHKLYGLRYDLSVVVAVHQQIHPVESFKEGLPNGAAFHGVKMIRCNGIIEHLNSVPFFRFPKPIHPVFSISGKLKQ